MDEDSGVTVLEGWRAVGGLEADRLVVDIARRLIGGRQPIGVAAVAARKKN